MNKSMDEALRSLSWGFNSPELQQDLYQVGALAWLESEAKGEDRAATEAWEAMNDFMSTQALPVSVPMHRGTRAALKKIRSGEAWSEGDVLDKKTFESLYYVVNDFGAVREDFPNSEVPDPEFEVYFNELEGLIESELGEDFRELFSLHYGPMGHTLTEAAERLDISPSKAKHMNVRIKEVVKYNS